MGNVLDKRAYSGRNILLEVGTIRPVSGVRFLVNQTAFEMTTVSFDPYN